MVRDLDATQQPFPLTDQLNLSSERLLITVNKWTDYSTNLAGMDIDRKMTPSSPVQHTTQFHLSLLESSKVMTVILHCWEYLCSI